MSTSAVNKSDSKGTLTSLNSFQVQFIETVVKMGPIFKESSFANLPIPSSVQETEKMVEEMMIQRIMLKGVVKLRASIVRNKDNPKMVEMAMEAIRRLGEK